jgi:hypothetical protein
MLKPSTVKQAFLNISKSACFGEKKKRKKKRERETSLNDVFWHKNKRFVFNPVFFNIGLDSELIIQTTEI